MVFVSFSSYSVHTLCIPSSVNLVKYLKSLAHDYKASLCRQFVATYCTTSDGLAPATYDSSCFTFSVIFRVRLLGNAKYGARPNARYVNKWPLVMASTRKCRPGVS